MVKRQQEQRYYKLLRTENVSRKAQFRYSYVNLTPVENYGIALAVPVQEFLTLSQQKKTIREICQKNNYPEDGLNEINTTVSEIRINALSKLTANQESRDNRLQLTDEKWKKTKQHLPLPTIVNNSISLVNYGYCSIQPNYQRTIHNPSRGGFQNFGIRGRPRNNRPRFMHQIFFRGFLQKCFKLGCFGRRQQTRPRAEIRTSTSTYFPVTTSSKKFYCICGNPNQKTSQCLEKGRSNSRVNFFHLIHAEPE